MAEEPVDKTEEKHLQLGLDSNDLHNGDPVSVEDDPEAIEDIWANATTVEQYKEDIELIDREGLDL